MKISLWLEQLRGQRLKGITFHSEKQFQNYAVDIEIPKDRIITLMFNEECCANERPPRKVLCQLEKGHKGSHRAVIYWE